MEMPASKRRPALVLSSRAFNENNDHTIFVMVTTAAASTWLSDYALGDPGAAGLTKSCYVRWKTFTLPNHMIVRQLGQISLSDQREIDAQMKTIFGLRQSDVAAPVAIK
jgi:mRNA interferase MazF